MNILDILLISISLAMDAFAVSICKGFSIKKINLKYILIIAFYFGLFQALMPIIGYYLGIGFKDYIEFIDHWLAFILLGILGINMLLDKDKEKVDSSYDFKSMIGLSIATSIDALVVGITFSFFNTNLLQATSIIGITTFIICFVGVIIGNRVGNKIGNKANIFGGVALILIGLKILIEHLFL